MKSPTTTRRSPLLKIPTTAAIPSHPMAMLAVRVLTNVMGAQGHHFWTPSGRAAGTLSNTLQLQRPSSRPAIACKFKKKATDRSKPPSNSRPAIPRIRRSSSEALTTASSSTPVQLAPTSSLTAINRPGKPRPLSPSPQALTSGPSARRSRALLRPDPGEGQRFKPP